MTTAGFDQGTKIERNLPSRAQSLASVLSWASSVLCMLGLRRSKFAALLRLSVSESSSCQRVVSALEPLCFGGPTAHAPNSNTVDVATKSTLAESLHRPVEGDACLRAKNRRTSVVQR